MGANVVVLQTKIGTIISHENTFEFFRNDKLMRSLSANFSEGHVHNKPHAQLHRLGKSMRLAATSIRYCIRISIISRFDNLPSNPVNPDPNKGVRWGPASQVKMMDCWIEYLAAALPTRLP
jgi:hypothetical protein